MCWPEADQDPVQGVAGLEKAQLAGLVSAAPAGPRSIGGCCVSQGLWVPIGFWLGTGLASSPPPAPTAARSQLPSLKVLTVQTQAPISESTGDRQAAGCSHLPCC